jgi:hypothetical protein
MIYAITFLLIFTIICILFAVFSGKLIQQSIKVNEKFAESIDKGMGEDVFLPYTKNYFTRTKLFHKILVWFIRIIAILMAATALWVISMIIIQAYSNS